MKIKKFKYRSSDEKTYQQQILEKIISKKDTITHHGLLNYIDTLWDCKGTN